MFRNFFKRKYWKCRRSQRNVRFEEVFDKGDFTIDIYIHIATKWEIKHTWRSVCLKIFKVSRYIFLNFENPYHLYCFHRVWQVSFSPPIRYSSKAPRICIIPADGLMYIVIHIVIQPNALGMDIFVIVIFLFFTSYAVHFFFFYLPR